MIHVTKNGPCVRIAALALCLIMLLAPLSSGLGMTAHAEDELSVEANAALLAEVDSEKILFEQDADKVIFPASTTKILTALLVIEALERGEISLEDEVEVSDTALEDIIWDASHVSPRIKKYEILTVRDFLYCVMLESDCASCNVLAEHTSGSIDAFVALMNERAQELGCENTNFTNPSGYPDENLYTTARSIYLIAREAIKHPLFVEIMGTTYYKTPESNLTRARDVYTTNRLLHVSGSDYYEYACGIKTGTTDAAGHCLVACAEKDGLSLISVVMGAQTVKLEDKSLKRYSFSETVRLFEWGFDNYSYRTFLRTDDEIASLPVTGAKSCDSVVLCPSEEAKALLPNDLDTAQLERNITMYETLGQAPFEKGTVFGEMQVIYEGETIADVMLVAGENVAETAYRKLLLDIGISEGMAIVVEANIALLIIAFVALMIKLRAKRRRYLVIERFAANRYN
ncbi:MAG: D-alanyl-D-alanine carboxypeptidase, partial [Clostridia bacterium]|nr:D-alanyl-D-alanine carboxypeptidase [Clostridia bacterium]